MASEMGVLPIPEKDIVRKWRLQPGKMLLIDLEKGRIVATRRSSASFPPPNPYQDWLERTQLVLEDLKPVEARASRTDVSLLDKQQPSAHAGGSLAADGPMAVTGQEAVGSMGTDTPISALSDKAKPLFTYFKQNFAQVTNPPIDPIREELVMSRVSFIGPRPNIFDSRATPAASGWRCASDPHQRGSGEDPLHRPFRGQLRHEDARHHLSVREGRGGHAGRARPPVRARRSGGSRPLQHHHPVGPPRRP